MVNNKSFTLIELVVALFLITVGTIGSFSLIQRILTLTSIVPSQFTAAYLTQEGIEITRNIRDTNWLEQRTNPEVLWDEGLLTGDWETDYNDSSLTSWAGEGRFLNIGSSGFYSYDVLDNPTKFKRKITILKPEMNKMVISVVVSFEERGRTHQVTAQTELYNWK